jgi:hypothetical protein
MEPIEHDDVIVITSEGNFCNKQSWGKVLTSQARMQLASAMIAPLRRNLDYQGVARRCLVIDPLPAGALPYYDKDIDVCQIIQELVTPSLNPSVTPSLNLDADEPDVIVINSSGHMGQKGSFNIHRVTVPTFNNIQNPSVKISDVKTRRFSLIDRAVSKAQSEIMQQEDENIFKALEDLAKKFTIR